MLVSLCVTLGMALGGPQRTTGVTGLCWCVETFSPAFPPGLPHGELGDGVTEPTSPPAGFPGLGQVQDQVSLSPKLAVKGFQARAAVYLQAGVILHCFIYKTQKDILSVDFFFLQTKEYARSSYWDLEDFSGKSGPSHAV